MIDDMPYFDFAKHYNLLVEEISKKKNLNKERIEILGNYYSMCEFLEWEYKKWDHKNWEKNTSYDKINSMYVAIYSSCNTRIIDFLKIYAPESIEEISYDDGEPLTITPFIENVEKSSASWFKRLFSSINFKPGYAGISVDIKKLFTKGR